MRSKLTSDNEALLKSYEEFSRSPFELSQLTEFNQNLVYGFDAEASLTQEAQDTFSSECVINTCLQQQDVLTGYLYAQEVVLPKLRDVNSITETDLLYWLDQIHLRMARTLANDAAAAGGKGASAGESCKRVLGRWHASHQVQSNFVHFIESKLSVSELVQSNEELNIPKELTIRFKNLLETVRSSKPYKLIESEKKYLDPNEDQVMLALFTRYYNDELSAEDKKLVEYFVKYCPLPDQRPALRENFAKELLIKLKQTSSNDLDQIADLAFWVFYQITEGHWYFNANGRVATCYLNLILRAFGQPSILMRNPGEKADPSSEYSQAIKHIDTNPQLLKAHIKARIVDCKKNGPYQDSERADSLMTQVALAKIRSKFLRHFPDYNTSAFNLRLQKKYMPEIKKVQERGENIFVYFLGKYIDEFSQLFTTLKEEKRTKLISQYKLTEKSVHPDFNKGVRFAAAFNNVCDMKFLLEECNCDIDKRDDNPDNGKTPLHQAVIRGSTDAVKFLLAAGASRNIPDRKSNKTAIDYAREGMIEKNGDEIKQLLGIVTTAPENEHEETTAKPF